MKIVRRSLLGPVERRESSALVARNRSYMVHNRSWRVLDKRNGDVVLDSGIAKKLAIASGTELPTAELKNGQLFMKKEGNKNKLLYYQEV